MLPDAVMQGMGWQPPPPGPDLGAPPDVAPPPGLHPAVLQGLGVAPPAAAAGPAPIAAPAPPPSDASMPPPPAPSEAPAGAGGPGAVLPSAAAQPPAASVPPREVKVEPPAARPAPGPAPAAPQRPAAAAVPKPLSVEQQMQQNQAALGTAAQDERTAIGAQTQAQLGQAADTLKAEQDYAARARELQAQAAKQREQANQAHELAQRQVTNRMKALDDYNIDQTKFWDDMGVGSKIGFFVGAALSGISNALSGKGDAPNPIIGMLQDRMKQSIQLQMDKRDQMAKGLGYAQDLMHEGDLYQAKKAADIAAAETDATKMLKIQVDLATAKAADPTIRANGLAESAKLGRQLSIDQQNATEKLANYNIQKQQVAIAGGHLALAQKTYDLDVAWKSWQQNREQQQLDLAAAKEALAERKAIGEKDAQLGVSAPVADGKGGAATGMLTNKDGTIWHANRAEEATKVQDMVASAQTYNALVRKMITNIREHGGESDYLKSADWQRMHSDFEASVAELHEAYGIKTFLQPAIDFFTKMTAGGIDPTSFVYDATAALTTSAENLQSKVNTKLKAANYTGQPISFAPLNPPTAASPDQQILTSLKDNRDGGAIGRQIAASAAAAGNVDLANRISGLQGKLDTVNALEQRAANKDAAAADMLKAVVADESIAAPVRTAAQKALADALTERQAASYGGADKSFSVLHPASPAGRAAEAQSHIPGIIQRINNPIPPRQPAP